MILVLFWLLVASAVGSALIAGVFYAFSTFVMQALARRPAAEGMAAMQSINVVVLNPLFLGPFLGLVPATVGAAALAAIRTDSAIWAAAGAALYGVGTFGTTILRNVPLNNQLAAANPHDEASADLWAMYLRRWTFWNHVRTAAGIAAATAFVVAATRV